MEYKSANDLLAVLEGRGLVIRDRALASHMLETIGYHRLSSFFPPFFDGSGAKAFDAGIPAKADDVQHLYAFDRRLRLLVMGPLEKIEIALRSLLIVEIGGYLQETRGDPVTINLFDPALYDLSTAQNRKNFRTAQEQCRGDARSRWNASAPKFGRRGQSLTADELRQRFEAYYRALPAWAIIQTASFGAPTYLYSCLRKEIADKIANRFRLPRAVLITLFFALKELRNACAHHDPIWNWDANRRSTQIGFPKRYRGPAGIDNRNERSLYPYLALIHILLGFLSNGRSTWHRRLKKLVNEFGAIYGANMGFPNNWQSMPFWCVSDVSGCAQYEALRARIDLLTKP
jgi:abortive infection bacteriophage resistance protein